MRKKVAVVIFVLFGPMFGIFAAADTHDVYPKDSLIFASNIPSSVCFKSKKDEVAGVPVWEILGASALLVVTKMSIDADGAPNAYHPEDIGLDSLANAGRHGNWWALATDTGRRDGRPVVQGASDPFPGFYVSTTSLFDTTKPKTDPGRYIDSRLVPYFVLPEGRFGGARLGDLGVVINLKTNRISPAIFADVGSRDQIGEGSIRLAQNLGIDSDPRSGGVSSGVAYLVFPGSGSGKPIPPEGIESKALAWFRDWGGIERIRECLQ